MLITILFLTSSCSEAQEHHFTNPQVRVQVTAETLTDSKYTDSRVKEVVRRKIWIAATVIQTKAEVIITTPQKIFPLCWAVRGTPALANYDRNQQGTGSRNERRGRRGSDSMRQYCEVDRKKHCPNMPPSREMMQCMMRNKNKFSAQCRQALQNHRPPGRR